MGDRWEEQKEKIASLRAEYAALFTHLHFMQGLRFAVLAATLPILGALFNYYRFALPFSQLRAVRQGIMVNVDPAVAGIAAIIGLGTLFASRAIERGINIHMRIIVDRGSEIETELGIISGMFSALQRRLNSPLPHRISGIIILGYTIGNVFSVVLIAVALWAMSK
jgi:hypothetical protein